MKIVIIGGVAAGAKAAAKVKRLLPYSEVEIYTDDTHVSYSACGLPYFIEGSFTDYRVLLVRSVEEFKKSGIDVYLESKVEKIIPKSNSILVCKKGDMRLVSYDKLVIATGAYPFIPVIKGYKAYKNLFTLRKIEDGINIRNKMLKSKTALIIGGGYIGLELLESFVKNGLKVDVIDRNDNIASSFDTDVSQNIRKNLEKVSNGNFKFYTNETVSEFIGNNNILKSVKTLSGKNFNLDFVIIASGVRPNVEIAKDAGIELGITGAIKVNKLMQTSIENIYACGDCAEKRHLVTNKNVWIPLGSTANKEGRCAALNVAGIYSEFEGVLGSVVTRCLNTTMAMTGITEREALKCGYSPISVTITKDDKVGYMPNVEEITLKVIADKVTGLLLGAQAIGSISADKIINSITTALLAHMTVDELKNNDTTYAPPYSTTIDPMYDAMELLSKKLLINS